MIWYICTKKQEGWRESRNGHLFYIYIPRKTEINKATFILFLFLFYKNGKERERSKEKAENIKRPDVDKFNVTVLRRSFVCAVKISYLGSLSSQILLLFLLFIFLFLSLNKNKERKKEIKVSIDVLPFMRERERKNKSDPSRSKSTI